MIGIVEGIRTAIAVKPSKWTIIALAVMGAILVMQLVAAVHAGPSIDGGH
ncbi:MAG: hypothetical protein QW756_02300 [Nitrososphaerota archaeon]